MQKHIDLIAKHEEEFLSRRTWDERVGGSVSSLVGSVTLVAFHVILLLLWITTNTGLTFHTKPFDPPPFPIPDLLLAFESILLASFILMRQSRIARRSDERNHLELQLMLLMEKSSPRISPSRAKLPIVSGYAVSPTIMRSTSSARKLLWIRWPRVFASGSPANTKARTMQHGAVAMW